MTTADLFALSPLISVAATSIIVMLFISFRRSHTLTALLTISGLVLSFGLLFQVSSVAPHRVASMLIIDPYALFYMGLVLLATIVTVAFSFEYLKGRKGDHDEYYLLMLLALLGALTIVASSHFAAFFLGLELLSVSLYSLLAYLKGSDNGVEAAIKYLVLASVSTAFLLFGIALIYAETGTMEFRTLALYIASLASRAEGLSPLMLSGFGMILIGLGFKLALAPFHMWTPDVYEGAPMPVTAFVATVSKGAVFAFMLRFAVATDIQAFPSLFKVVSLLAIFSMFTGNLLALLQKNIKRVLAYSSIAHLGYLLVAFQSHGKMALTATAYYLVAYFVTTLGAFGVIIILSGKGPEADDMDDYQGLAMRHPWLAGIFTAMLFSLAGLPLTAGFIGKFSLIAAGTDAALWLLVLALMLNSAIGLFYYLRIVSVMYMPEKEGKRPRIVASQVSFSGGVILALLTLLLVGLGVYPSPLMQVIEKTVLRLL